MHKPTLALLATIATLAVSLPTHAAPPERHGFDPAQASSLAGVPVHVAVIDARLQLQVPLVAWSEDRDASEKAYARSEVSGYGPGKDRVVAFRAIKGGVSGEKASAETIRAAGAPGASSFQALLAAGCDLPAGETFAHAVESGVHATVWGRDATFVRHLVPSDASTSGASQLLPRPALMSRWANLASTGRADLSPLPSYEFEVRYSLTPDLAAIVTTVMARAYSNTLRGERAGWQGVPAWSDELVVVSDALPLERRTAADIAESVAREDTYFRTTSGIVELAKKANAGDMDARQQGWLLQQEHKRALEEARSAFWPWRDAAARRVGPWTQNSCARVHQALDANAVEVTRLLGLLFAGELDATLPADWSETTHVLFGKARPPTRSLATGAAAQERRVYTDGPRIAVSRRAGDDVMLDFRYTWLGGDASEQGAGDANAD